jgi:AAA domain
VSRSRSPLVSRAGDLSRSRPPRWLWRNRYARGYLNLMLGAEKTGKGVLAARTIAAVTRGWLPGNLYGKPAAVGILGDEDSFDDMWVPRLHAAGADLGLVRLIERRDGGTLALSDHQTWLARQVNEHELKLLYLDALIDNLGVNVDDWRAKQVREALQPARALARRHQIAVIGSLHPNKRGTSFRQLVSGSVQFNAVSRSSLLLAQHPERKNWRVLCRGGGNLSIEPPPVEFEIVSHRFSANGRVFDVPVARGFAKSRWTRDDLLAEAATPLKENSKEGACRALIAALLAHDAKWYPARPIYEACETEGYKSHVIKRAREDLPIEVRDTSSFPARGEWRWTGSLVRGAVVQ